MEAQLAALRQQSEANNAELARLHAAAANGARDALLTQLGVKPQYLEFAPANLDARTAEGKAGLEKWAADRPDIRIAAGSAGPAPTPSKLLAAADQNPLAKSPFYNAAALVRNAEENGIKL